MFDFLKKKLSNFVETIVGKAEEKKAEAPQEKEVAPEIASTPLQTSGIEQKAEQAVETVEVISKKPEAEEKEIWAPVAKQEVKHEEKVHAPKSTEVAISKPVELTAKHVEKVAQKPVEQTRVAPAPAVVTPPVVAKSKETISPVAQPVVKVSPKVEEKKPEIELAPKLGLLSRIKSVFTPEIEISEKELAPVLEQLEIALLESDVSFDATQHFLAQLRTRLAGKKVRAGSAGEEIKKQVKESLLSLFPGKQFDLYNYVTALKNENRVGVVLFVGPNGSGKTTTIAKLAKQFSDRGVQCVIAAGDTFRKAAIEQAKVHGERLDVRVVAHQYGADPTAVAFDAVAHAKANNKQVVLVDTAGRQETNLNLVREMEKLNRVIKPDLKIFVGEAIAGNALASQASEFNKTIALDGIVLTKLDCDAKGGGAFSIAFETKLPILFIGVGQEYDDLKPFDAEWLCNSVLAA